MELKLAKQGRIEKAIIAINRTIMELKLFGVAVLDF